MKHSASFRLRVNDLSQSDRLKESALLALLQEVATEHANILHLGAADLIKKNLGWALSKLDIHISSFPKSRQKITLETWASEKAKITTERDFIAYSASGENILQARSLWVLFNLEKRKIERLNVLEDWPRITETRANGDLTETLKKPENPQYTLKCHLRKDDMDINGHINNCIYQSLAIDALPNEFYQTHEPERIQISFLAEAKFGDEILSICEIAGNETYHQILNNDKESARLNIKWKKLENKF